MNRAIYLDNSMTTRPSDTAVGRMLTYYSEKWGTPSAPHQKGQELFPAMQESLISIYELLGANEKDGFVFTSSGAEATNQVILSAYFDTTKPTGKNQFITSHIDEAPQLMAIGRLQQHLGCVGKMVNPDESGMVTADAIAEAITPRTALVSLAWANGLTGVINPIAEIASICEERGILFHLDATHVLGKLFYELNGINASFISFDGTHLHAPAGTGGLYIKSGVHCAPLIMGGLEQAGLRAGNINIPGLVALGQAAREAMDSRDFVCTEVARLRNLLEDGIVQAYPEAVVFFQNSERLPHCTTIGFPGINNEALLYALNRQGVYGCIGGGNFQQIALILKASKVPAELAQTAINFSLSRYTTEEEITRAITIIGETAHRLRKTSARLEVM